MIYGSIVEVHYNHHDAKSINIGLTTITLSRSEEVPTNFRVHVFYNGKLTQTFSGLLHFEAINKFHMLVGALALEAAKP